VLHQHLRRDEFVRDYRDVEADDSDEAMEAAAADRPVFRLDPAAD